MMSDSKEYVSRSDELGGIHISEEVLATIAAAAALEVEGVGSLANAGKKNLARDVRVKMEDDKVQVDLSILMSYGSPSPRWARPSRTRSRPPSSP